MHSKTRLAQRWQDDYIPALDRLARDELLRTAHKGNVQAVRELLAGHFVHTSPSDAVGHGGLTPLHAAFMSQWPPGPGGSIFDQVQRFAGQELAAARTATVKALLENDAVDVNSATCEGVSVLHMAACTITSGEYDEGHSPCR